MQLIISFLILFICVLYFTNKNIIVLFIKEINKVYKEILHGNNLLIKITECFLIFFSIIPFSISLSIVINKYYFFNNSLFKETISFIFIFIIVYYLYGYLLLLTRNINKYLYNTMKENMEGIFLLSFFLISIFFIILLLMPECIERYSLSLILSIIISYVINFYILINIVKNFRCIKINENDRASFMKILVAVVILLIMIILDLFFFVCLTSIINKGAYSNNPDLFDLFYYTVVSFTTIGIGDIIPISKAAKFITVLIGFSSIFITAIIIGAIYSNRKK